jgi:hypothetical protein
MRQYGELRHDLTPLDLFVNGYVVRAHIQPDMWCWWHKNPYGEGMIYSAPFKTLDEVYASARWLMTAQTTVQPALLEVAA